MNIRNKKTGTVHKFKGRGLYFYIDAFCNEFYRECVEETTDPVTCKTCIRWGKVKP